MPRRGERKGRGRGLAQPEGSGARNEQKAETGRRNIGKKMNKGKGKRN